MSLLITLSPKEEEKLNEWLLTKKIVLNHRTRRDLSDVVTIAHLFKKLDPHLVNMNNYASHCSLALKLENWQVFNLKVLRRLGLPLSPTEMEDLALGRLNALKALLYRLMYMERDGGSYHVIFPRKPTTATITTEHRKPPQFHQEVSKSDQQLNDLVISIPHGKPVSYAKYELLMDENGKKEKYLSSISKKVQYLESLILVKEERINDLLHDLYTLSSSRVRSTQSPLNGDDEQQQQ